MFKRINIESLGISISRENLSRLRFANDLILITDNLKRSKRDAKSAEPSIQRGWTEHQYKCVEIHDKSDCQRK